MASQMSCFAKWVMLGGDPYDYPGSVVNRASGIVCQYVVGGGAADVSAPPLDVYLYLMRPGYVFNRLDDTETGTNASQNIKTYLLAARNGYAGRILLPGGSVADDKWYPVAYMGNNMVRNVLKDSTPGASTVRVAAVGGSIGPFVGALVSARDYVIGYIDFTTQTNQSYIQPDGGTLTISNIQLSVV